MSTFKIGCDPEIFVFNEDTFKFEFPLFIPGTKEQPYRVNKGAIQRDGASAEINIDPASSADEFYDNIREVIYGGLLPHLKAAGNYKLALLPAIPLPRTDDKSLLVLGCDPDYNAYNKGQANPIPKDGLYSFYDPLTGLSSHNYIRTASGHVHVGWTDGEKDYANPAKPHFIDCMVVTNQLDVFLGVPLVGNCFHNVNRNNEAIRRQLYGNAGAFRPKPYGMEYRVPSCVWLSTKENIQRVFHLTTFAMMALEEGVVASDKVFNNIYRQAWNRRKIHTDTSQGSLLDILSYGSTIADHSLTVLTSVVKDTCSPALQEYWNTNCANSLNAVPQTKLLGDLELDYKATGKVMVERAKEVSNRPVVRNKVAY